MKKYIKLSEYAKNHNLSYVTAYNHFKKGFVPNTKQLITGTILVEEEQEKTVGVIKKRVYTQEYPVMK